MGASKWGGWQKKVADAGFVGLVPLRARRESCTEKKVGGKERELRGSGEPEREREGGRWAVN